MAHDHGPGPAADRRLLGAALGLILGLMVAEVVAGVLAGSLALIADAGHMLTDAAALGLAIVAIRLAARPASGAYTYGLKRVEILSAQLNGVTLAVLVVVFTYEAVRRLMDPPQVQGGLVAATAGVGIAVNLAATLLIRRADRRSLNVEGAFQHVLNDLFAFIATLVAGVVVLLTGWDRADAVAALAVAVLMARASYGLLRDSGRIFLEASPRGLDPAAIEAAVRAVPDVSDVHELHVWEVTSGFPALSAHVLVAPGSDCHERRIFLEDLLLETFGIDHTTLQVDHRHDVYDATSLGRRIRPQPPSTRGTEGDAFTGSPGKAPLPSRNFGREATVSAGKSRGTTGFGDAGAGHHQSMADEPRPEPASDEPSLELPSLRSALGFGRKRGKKAGPPPDRSEPEDSPLTEPLATTAPVEPGEPMTPTEPGTPLEPLVPVEPDLPAPPSDPGPAPVPVEPAEPSAPEPSDSPPPPAPDVPVVLPGAPSPEITPGPIGLLEADPTVALPAAAMTAPEEQAPATPKPRRSLPRVRIHLPGPVVALLTGAVVGLALVGLTSASLHLCSAMRGTSSCGKPGLLLLLVITVAMVMLGSVLLRLAGVETSGSTSFLGVGLLVVVILLALLPVIFDWWMVVVVPLVAMATYTAAWWLTTTYVEPGERVR
ncbi:cation diffusion facilitator family transporter [Nocardioides cynanchi]|uniref:cation diffusion facilitator family transporter n=1 Tax=Nocardioides cynanchi TaxID=2558918 RepID=UPI0012484848|nr:cation diffusion facilitator family transporter [Nocardioides cynanchi]